MCPTPPPGAAGSQLAFSLPDLRVWFTSFVAGILSTCAPGPPAPPSRPREKHPEGQTEGSRPALWARHLLAQLRASLRLRTQPPLHFTRSAFNIHSSVSPLAPWLRFLQEVKEGRCNVSYFTEEETEAVRGRFVVFFLDTPSCVSASRTSTLSEPAGLLGN